MRILMVSPMPPAQEAIGSIPLLLHAQIMALRQQHDVTVVTVAGPSREDLEAVDQLAAEGVDVHAARRDQSSSLRRWKLAGPWLLGSHPFRTTWFRDSDVQRLLDGLVSTKGFDIIAVEDNAMGVYRYPVGIPVVLTEHEVRRPRPVEWRRPVGKGLLGHTLAELDWRRWPKYQIKIWSRFDRLQVFTKRDAETMRAIAPSLADRVWVTPFGIEVPAAPNPEREEPGTVLFAGGFHHPPNRDAALWLGQEIMPLVHELSPQARLTIVGSFPPSSVLALESPYIRVAGQVPEIRPFLQQTSIVVAPIRIGGGMRVKVLQGMAMGKPVVTTPRGAEGLDYAGIPPPVLIAEDPAGIADCLVKLIASPLMRADLGERAREFVSQHFSAQAYAERLTARYEELLPTRKAIA